MLVTSLLPIQSTKILYSFFNVRLGPHFEKVPPPMGACQGKISAFVIQTDWKHSRKQFWLVKCGLLS